MHERLLENYRQLDRANLISYAADLGLDVKRFTNDLDSKKYDNSIERDKGLAVSLDLFNTPTFFVNGSRHEGIPADDRVYEYLKGLVVEELKYVKK